jgi:hypothetical protein
MDLTNPSDRRMFPRKRALRGGRMVSNNASSTINCTLRNISDAGARLDVASVLGIPAVFDLKLDGQPSRSCEVVWRSSGSGAIGIAFTSF